MKTDDEPNINWMLKPKLTVPIKYDYLKLLFEDQHQSHNSKLFIINPGLLKEVRKFKKRYNLK